MPQSTAFIGHKAFARRQQLTEIDLSQTQVNIVHMQVFSHCRSLAQISLPKHLAEISAEAFEACVSLCTVALPQQLRCVGHRAFAGCSKLVCLTYRSTKAGRRRLQVAANAFVKHCPFLEGYAICPHGVVRAPEGAYSGGVEIVKQRNRTRRQQLMAARAVVLSPTLVKR